MSTKGESFSSALHGEALFTAKRPELQPLIDHLREVAQVATTFVLIDGFGLVGTSARGDSAVRLNQLPTPVWCGPTAAPSRSYAATAPSRPAVSKLRSSCQAVHVHRQNIGVPQTTGSPSDRPRPRLLLDHRSHAHHLGHGYWLRRLLVCIRRLQLRTRTRV